MSTIYQHKVKTIEGQELGMEHYQGKTLLIVNTASACGFTPQYQGLEDLYKKYKDQGLEILGFPCNQFGQQEKGAETEIAAFCEKNYGVTFPMFSKVDVNGDNAHPLFQELTDEARGVLGSKKIKWNFTKFLVSKEGKVLKRFASATKPANLADTLEQVL